VDYFECLEKKKRLSKFEEQKAVKKNAVIWLIREGVLSRKRKKRHRNV